LACTWPCGKLLSKAYQSGPKSKVRHFRRQLREQGQAACPHEIERPFELPVFGKEAQRQSECTWARGFCSDEPFNQSGRTRVTTFDQRGQYIMRWRRLLANKQTSCPLEVCLTR
jgi:hypothetical protein